MSAPEPTVARTAYTISGLVEIPKGMTDIFAARKRPERVNVPVRLAPDTWIVRGYVADHVDGKNGERAGHVTLGLILYTSADDYCLIAENRYMPLYTGTVYRLDPNVLHGAARFSPPGGMFGRIRRHFDPQYEHENFVFLAWDMPVEKEMTPHTFAAAALEAAVKRWAPPAKWDHH